MVRHVSVTKTLPKTAYLNFIVGHRGAEIVRLLLSCLSCSVTTGQRELGLQQMEQVFEEDVVFELLLLLGLPGSFGLFAFAVVVVVSFREKAGGPAIGPAGPLKFCW